METSRAELDTRTDLTTIKLAAQLIERGRGGSGRDARRAREITAAVDRICASLERSSAELRQLTEPPGDPTSLVPRQPSIDG